MEEFDLLTTHLEKYLNLLNPAERTRLAMDIARKVRKSQNQRITRQQNPDGSQYIPRKTLRNKKGKIKNKMFQKLKTAKFLKIEKMPNGVSIGFNERVSKLARVHQEGLQDIVRLDGRSIKVRYAQRILLGFTEAEIEITENEVLQHFDK
ncbi:phage virion morphogenesis protein [Acinetobacter sp. VNK23]|uniref:phage virion morphogenesis protein n=1 Tax=Acinetobacter thutiue TaxID=2998078 RepID=UPI002577732A|nr:phage virion morphogenesis protein [Acinetobacter thutiue]MDM1022068.1 phage virion morphogenesis protein [Acinetobacter thutiue]